MFQVRNASANPPFLSERPAKRRKNLEDTMISFMKTPIPNVPAPKPNDDRRTPRKIPTATSSATSVTMDSSMKIPDLTGTRIQAACVTDQRSDTQPPQGCLKMEPRSVRAEVDSPPVSIEFMNFSSVARFYVSLSLGLHCLLVLADDPPASPMHLNLTTGFHSAVMVGEAEIRYEPAEVTRTDTRDWEAVLSMQHRPDSPPGFDIMNADDEWGAELHGTCDCWNTTEDGRDVEVECRCGGLELTDIPNNLAADVHRIIVPEESFLSPLFSSVTMLDINCTLKGLRDQIAYVPKQVIWSSPQGTQNIYNGVSV
ncbi:hypothetical protein ANN_17509 [Periplaneta americana]|uniref:GPS domain-containing protein n=1 Tax=Periplaneta americana TaxID=6978 RepID=A0ABQ8ST56_PERAM|nr:hypothetical protein ANN_17509 [Periplaneta americana]